MTTNHKTSLLYDQTSVIYPQVLYDAYGNEIKKEDSSNDATLKPEDIVTDTSDSFTTLSHGERATIVSEAAERLTTKSYEMSLDPEEFTSPISLTVQNNESTFTSEYEEQSSEAESSYETTVMDISLEGDTTSDERPGSETETSEESFTTVDDFSSRDSAKVSSPDEKQPSDTGNVENYVKSTVIAFRPVTLSPVKHKKKPSNPGVINVSDQATKITTEDRNIQKISTSTSIQPVHLFDEYDIYDYYDDIFDQDFDHIKASTIRGPDIFEIAAGQFTTLPTLETEENVLQKHTPSQENDLKLQTFYPDLENSVSYTAAHSTTSKKERPKPFFPTIPFEANLASETTPATKIKISQRPYFPTIPFESNFAIKLKTKTTQQEKLQEPAYSTMPSSINFKDKLTTVTVSEDLERSTESESNQGFKTTIVTIDNHRPPVSTLQTSNLNSGSESTFISTFSEDNPSATESVMTEAFSTFNVYPTYVTTQTKTDVGDSNDVNLDTEIQASTTRQPTIKYPFPTIHMKHTTKHFETTQKIPLQETFQQETSSEYFGTNSVELSTESAEDHTTNNDSSISSSVETSYDPFFHDPTQVEFSENAVDFTRNTISDTTLENLPLAEKWASSSAETGSEEITTETFVEMTQPSTPLTTRQETTTPQLTSDGPKEETTSNSSSTTTSLKTTAGIKGVATTTITPTAPSFEETTTVTVPTTTEFDLDSADFKQGKIVYRDTAK